MNEAKVLSKRSFLNVSTEEHRLHIRVPQIDGEHQYLHVLGELGMALRNRKDGSDVVVQIADLSDFSISLAAVLFRLKEEVENYGGAFKVVVE